MAGRKYDLDERAESLLNRHYDSRTETITVLARTLGVPRHTVKRWAQVLGLARTKERPWSDDEVRYLESHYHRLHILTMARHLKRSGTAVALKAKRLRIRKCGEGYTATGLAVALGVDSHKVIGWSESGKLRAERRRTDRENDPYLILDEDVRKFIMRHPLEIDMRKVDGVWLIDVLTSDRPGVTRNGASPDTVDDAGGSRQG